MGYRIYYQWQGILDLIKRSLRPSNKQGRAEAYKDVIHEDAIKVGGITKAPDYCFRIGGARKFFLEAKKPSVNIHGDIHPAFQLRRYGWSAKLPISVLTDFEEFAVYDCRVKPTKTDIGKLPIRPIDSNDSADIALRDKMIELVNQMLDLNRKLAESKIPQARQILKRQIEQTDKQIDQLAFELYELTDEELHMIVSED